MNKNILQKGSMTLWLIVIAIILAEALYIKALKSEIATLKSGGVQQAAQQSSK